MKRPKTDFLTVKSRKGQSLNSREAELIGSGRLPGFLRISAREERQTWRLDYDIGGLITLREFLSMTILSRRMFAGLLKNLVKALEAAEKERLSQSLMVFDLDGVWLSPSSWEIFLQYIPLQPAVGSGSFRELLLQIVQVSSFDHREDTAYAQRFAKTVSADLTCSVFSVREYIDQLQQESTVKEDRAAIRCPFCGSRLEQNEKRCPACGHTVSARFQKETKGRSSFVQPDTEGQAVFIDSSVPAPAAEGTGLTVNQDENGIVTVFRGVGGQSDVPWLEQCSDGVHIPINKLQFRLGRCAGRVDYCVQGRFVSRIHAQILQREQDYLLIDCRSTNGTYLNGQRLAPHQPQQLRDGSRIRLGTAEFIFHL